MSNNEVKPAPLYKNRFEPAPLCKCNNCGTVMLDNNPQVGAPLFEVKIWSIHSMEYVKPNKDEEGFWACPKCQTDDYLTDEINEEDKEKLRKFWYLK